MWNIILLGILLNTAVYICFRNVKGIDAMPAFPILAGYLYGSNAGFLAGIIIAATYYILNLRAIHYAPLTVASSAFIGFIAGFLTGIDMFVVGIALLCVYHLLSGFFVSIFGALKPGYFAFVLMNVMTSVVDFYISSFVL